MGNKKATGFLCLRLVPCFAYVGAEDNRKGIPFVKIVSLLCKLIQFLMVALSVTVHKALILLVFLNHPYQSLAFSNLSGAFKLFFDYSSSVSPDSYQTNLFSASILGCSLFHEIVVVDVAC
jgi:hypothetical protein